MVPIYRIARAGVLGIYVISWVGMISLAVLIFHRISEVAAGLLGIRLKGRSQLYVATALVLTFSVAMLLPRFMKRRKPISGSQRAVLTAARRFSGPFENCSQALQTNPSVSQCYGRLQRLLCFRVCRWGSYIPYGALWAF